MYSLTTHSLEKAVLSINLFDISPSPSWWVPYGTVSLTCSGTLCLFALDLFKVLRKHFIVTPLAVSLHQFFLKLITTLYPGFDLLDVIC